MFGQSEAMMGGNRWKGSTLLETVGSLASRRAGEQMGGNLSYLLLACPSSLAS